LRCLSSAQVMACPEFASCGYEHSYLKLLVLKCPNRMTSPTLQCFVGEN
jgi:hypothetical protein